MEALHIYPTKDQEKVIVAFLEALNVPYEKEGKLPEHVINGINHGLNDVKEGRTISLQEFQARRLSSK